MYSNFLNFMEGDCPKKYKKYKKSDENKFLNDIELRIAFANNVNMALDIFEWEGLPDTCNDRFLEMMLLFRGMACVYNDPVLGYINPMCGLGGELNLYGEPAEITLAPYGTNMDALKLSGKRVPVYMRGSDNTDVPAVWFRDNPIGIPYIYAIMEYSEKMADCLRSITVAAKALKVPWILTAPKELVESIQDAVEQIDSNELVVVCTSLASAGKTELFNTNSNPEVLKALWENYRNLSNELRTILGVQNQENTDKKERLLVDEINSNNEYVNINGDIRLRARQEAAEIINKVFGLSVSVRYRNKKEVEEDADNVQGKENASETENAAE